MIDWTKVPTHELIVEIIRIHEAGKAQDGAYGSLVTCSRAAQELDRRMPVKEENGA